VLFQSNLEIAPAESEIIYAIYIQTQFVSINRLFRKRLEQIDKIRAVRNTEVPVSEDYLYSQRDFLVLLSSRRRLIQYEYYEIGQIHVSPNTHSIVSINRLKYKCLLSPQLSPNIFSNKSC
jgi:hypothetical protein